MDTVATSEDGGGPSIPEFYRSQTVLITGATGFMGKVLVEKLLRSCVDLKRVYIVLRAKKGKSPQERVKQMFTAALFDRLHDEFPDAPDKVVGLSGDMMELGLGLSQEDTKTLEEEVSVVFHVAATVKFDDPLKSAIFMNIRGTREVMELSTRMKQLKVVLHVSTTYCNCDRTVVEEQIYPPPGDWKKAIVAAETLDEHLLQILTPKIIGLRPNTYTYTKALGEHVIKDYSHLVPVVIFRPSVVISSLLEPFPGWMDNFNGPVGLLVAGGKGILRVIYARYDNVTDYMAVDVAIKSMIVAAWKTGRENHTTVIPVYNCSSSSVKGISIGDMIKLGFELEAETPLNNVLWRPGATITRHFASYYVQVMLFHILPAVFVDAILYAMSMQPMLVRLQRRIYIANTALDHFLHHEWYFPNGRLLALDKCVSTADRADWGFHFQDVNITEFTRIAFNGGRRYLLKEAPETLPQAKLHSKRMYILDRIVTYVGYAVLAWYVYTAALIPWAVDAVADFTAAVAQFMLISVKPLF